MKSAVFTVVKNEGFFLPIWLNYYSKHFQHEDMYVLDHQSDDGTTEELPCNKEVIKNEWYDDVAWLVSQVEKKQRELLQRYDVVLFTEADEIIIPDPRKYDGLKDYIDKFDKNTVKCYGWEVVQFLIGDNSIYPVEEKIKFDRPLLRQRKWWYRRGSHNFDKPLLSKVPLSWIYGFHTLKKGNAPLDENLYLVHLHKVDFEECVKRHNFKAMQKHKHSVGISWHDRLSHEEACKYCKTYETLLPIPDWIKDAI